jgi:hypothetical protein
MPTPSNAPSTSTGGSEVQDPQLFAELTERQAMPQITTPIKGLNQKQRLQVEKVGVVARVRLRVKYKFKTKAGKEPKLNPGWPWKMLKEIAMQANGVTGIIDCSAATLQQRRNRVYRNPASALLKGPAVSANKLEAAKEYEGEFVVEIPIAHDMQSLIGALLAQNEETNLSFLLTWASEEEIFDTAASIEAFEGSVEWASTVFSIGATVIGKKEVTVLPDLSAFHGLTEQELNLTGTGLQPAELVRTDGQLLCYTAAVTNKSGGRVCLSPAEWTRFQIEYGGNKEPLVWIPAGELLEENADDYNGALTVGGLTFLAVDQERDNAARDMIIPEALIELRAKIGIPTVGFTPEEARILTSQETLYPAV